MSTSVDQRVVELQFDNSNFEKNAQQSLSTLDKLKEKLSFKKAGEGLEELNRTIVKFTMKPIEDAVMGVYNKFTMLDNFVWNFYTKINNKLLDIASNTAKAFTIDPIKSGFEEYETQMDAVQTILANTQSKGSTLDDVNKALNELNHYADLTIYNFTQMTKNIGTFTAAGVGLEDATSAIQGIANLAAVSGSTSQQASVAMYQLSQALSAGSLKLQDWNSVVNAGMGGEVFQNALKQTAKEYGVAVDSIIDKAGTFRESLKEGWITSEILTTTLRKMTVTGADEYLANLTGISKDYISKAHQAAADSADMTTEMRKLAKELANTGKVTEDQAYQLLNMSTTAQDAATKVKTFSQLMDTLKEAAQSGWTQTWNLIIGDFEAAKKLFTEFSDLFSGLINESAESRNAIVAEAMGSSWEQLSTTLTDAGLSVDQFKEILIKNAKESGIAIDEWIEKDGSFEQTLSRGWLKDTDITKAFEDMANGVGTATMSMEEYQKVVTDVVRGDYGNGAKRVKELTAANYDYAEVQAQVNKCWDGATLDLSKLDTSMIKNLGLTEEQIQAYQRLAEESKDPDSAVRQMISDMSMPSGRDMLIDTIRNTLSGILTITNSIKKAFNDTFKPSAAPIKKFLKVIDNISKKFKEVEKYSDQLERTFSGLFSILGIIGDVVGGTVSYAFKLLGQNVNIDVKSIFDLTAKIGDAIVKFRQWLKDTNAVQNGLTGLKDKVKYVVDQVKSFITNFDGVSSIEGIVTRIQNGFKKLPTSLNIDFSKIKTAFSNLIEHLKTTGHIDLSEFSGVFSDLNEAVKNEIEGVDISFTGFVDYLKTKVVNGVSKAFNGLKGIFSGFIDESKVWIDAIKKTFSSLNWGVVLSVFNTAFVLKITDTITSNLGALADKFEPVTGILNKVKGAIGQFSNVLKAEALKTKAEALLEIAAAVGVLALSMTLLAAIKKEDFGRTILMLAVALASIASMAAVAAIINKSSASMTGAFASLVGIAVSIAMVSKIITTTLTTLRDANITIGEFIEMIGLMAISMVGLSLAVAVLGANVKFAGVTIGVNLKQVGPFLLTFAGFLFVFAKAMEALSKVDAVMRPEVAIQLLGTMSAVVLVARAVKDVDASAGIAVLAISGAMYILYKMLNDIPQVSDTKKWLKSLGSIIIITGVISKILGSLAGEISEHVSKAGIAMVGIASAMALLPLTIQMLGSIDTRKLTKGLGAVFIVGAIFSAMMVASKLAGEFAHKGGVMLLAASGAMLVMTGVIVTLGFIEQSTIDKAMNVIKGIGLLFGGMMIVSVYAKDSKGAIIAIGAVFTIMAASLAVLSSDLIDSNKLLAAALSLSGVMIAFGALFSLIGSTGTIAAATIGQVFAITGIVALLGGIVIAISALQNAGHIDVAIETIGSLSILLVAMSGALVLVSWAGKISGGLQGALIGLAALAIFIAGAYGLLTIIGELHYGMTLMGGVDYITEAIDTLGSIGYALGNMISEFFVGSVSGLPEIGNTLSTFMENMQYFLSGLEDIDSSKVENVGNLVEVLGKLFAGKFKIKDAKKNAEMYEKITANMDAFMPSLVSFSEACTGLNSSGLELGCDAIEALATASKDIPTEGGLKNWFTGETSWTNFGSGLSALGEAMVAFSTSCIDVDQDGLTKGAKCITILAEAEESIPNSGGLLAEWIGDNTWSKFKTDMPEMGEALTKFSDSVVGVNTDNIDKGAYATTALAKAAKEIPNSGGLIASLVGENDWDKFQYGLSTYGKALSMFSYYLNSVSSDNIDLGCSVTSKLSEAYGDVNKYPTSGYWEIIYAGLSTYGAALKQFDDSIKNIDPDRVLKAATATTYLSKAVVDLKTAGFASESSINWDNITANIESFRTILGADLDTLGNTMTDSTYSDMVRLRTYLSEIPKAFDAVNVIDDAAISKYTTRIDTLLNTVRDIKDASSSISLGLLKKSFANLAKDMFDGIAEGIDNDEQVLSATYKVGNSILAKFRDCLGISGTDQKSVKFLSYGYQCVKGFASGVNDNVGEATDAMTQLGSLVLLAFKRQLNIGELLTEAFTTPGNGSGSATVQGSMARAGSNAGTEFAEGVITAAGDVVENADTDGASNWVEDTVNKAVDTGKVWIDKAKGVFSGILSGDTQGILNSLGFDLDNLLGGGFDVSNSDISKYFKDLNKDVKGYSFNSLLDTAKSEFDEFFEAYKEGRISQSEYDKQYTDLLKKYTSEQAGIIAYGQEQMKKYLEDEFKEINKTYEDNIKDIQSKMDTMQSNYVQSMESAFTVKTNKDIYDEQLKERQDRVDELTEKQEELKTKYGEENILVKENAKNLETATKELEKFKKEHEENTEEGYANALAKYTDKIDKLTKKRARMAKRYGEESREVKQVQKQLEEANKEMEKWKSNHEVKKDDDIAAIEYGEAFKEQTVALTNYNSTVEKLKKKGVSQSVLDMLAGEKDIKKAAAIADYINNMSTDERKMMEAQYDIYQEAGKKVAKTFYGDELEQANLDYVNSIINKWNEIPDSAKGIGENIILGLTEGFSDATESSLATIGSSGEKITQELKDVFGIHSPSKVMKEEVGYYLADGLIQGFLERLRAYTSLLTGEVLKDFSFDTDDMVNVTSFDTTLNELTSAIQNRMNLQPTITPVLDMSMVDSGVAQWQATMGMQTPSYLMNTAMTVDSSDVSVVTAINSMSTTISSKLDSINPNPAINSLGSSVNSSIAALGNSMNNMSVVLDTGTLVGAMSSGMGEASTLKTRGS